MRDGHIPAEDIKRLLAEKPAAGTADMVLSVRLPAEAALERAGRTLPVELIVTLPTGERVSERSTFIVPR